MIAILVALAAQTASPYTYHIAAKPGTPVANLQTSCKKFEAAKSERDRQKLVPQIKKQFSTYQGDRDELLLRCQRRVEVR